MWTAQAICCIYRDCPDKLMYLYGLPRPAVVFKWIAHEQLPFLLPVMYDLLAVLIKAESVYSGQDKNTHHSVNQTEFFSFWCVTQWPIWEEVYGNGKIHSLCTESHLTCMVWKLGLWWSISEWYLIASMSPWKSGLLRQITLKQTNLLQHTSACTRSR